MGTEGRQGQPDLDSHDRQALKASGNALLFHNTEMHEKSSLTSWNSITLRRRCFWFFKYFYYSYVAYSYVVLLIHSRHGTNLMVLRRFTSGESSGSRKRCQTCQGQERHPLTEGEICASRFSVPTQNCRSWTLRGGWDSVTAPRIQGPLPLLSAHS